MTSPEIQLDLTIAEAETDDERLDELTGHMLRDLRELGAESVARPAGKAPAGAKAGDAFTLGALALVAVPAFLPQLIGFLQAWVLRGQSQSRTVKIKTPAGLEIEFTPEKRMSEAEVLDLVAKLKNS